LAEIGAGVGVIVGAVDHETVEMLVGPAEADLQGRVQVGKAGVTVDEKASLDEGDDSPPDDA
jgi:hypothetical protein